MQNGTKPFVVIASVRRTGSTVLSETLSQVPHAMILHETYLARGYFIVSKVDRDTFLKFGIDLAEYRDRWHHQQAKSLVPAFRAELMPALLQVVRQVGVKEIHLQGWESYVQQFPKLRIVLTGRDPRDIYLSLRGRYVRGTADWKGSFSPERVAADLMREFRFQVAMHETGLATKVRYEDLCTSPAEVVKKVKEFTQNDVPDFGPVGRYLGSDGGRKFEHQVHDGRLTAKRVGRWKREKDPEVRLEADQVFDLMAEYRAFWGYE